MAKLFILVKWYVKENFIYQYLSIINITLTPPPKIIVSFRTIINGNINMKIYDSNDDVPFSLRNIPQNYFNSFTPPLRLSHLLQVFWESYLSGGRRLDIGGKQPAYSTAEVGAAN